MLVCEFRVTSLAVKDAELMGVIANIQGIVIVNRSLVIRVWHKWSEHTRVGFLLDSYSTRVYTYTQYLHTRVFLHDNVAIVS